MPIICDIPLALDMKGILRRQGIRNPAKIQQETVELLHELMDTAEKQYLLKPAIVYELYPVTKVHNDSIILKDGILQGEALPSLFTSARELVIAICTIGSHLEEVAAGYFISKDPLRGLLLDGIGSAAIDSLTQEACKIIVHEASFRGYQASSPLSPGMAGFPISEQEHLFELVPAEEIGVRLTSSGMMVPRKSASMIIGIGPQMPTWTQIEACASCSSYRTCPHRITT